MSKDRSGLPVDRGWAWIIVLGYFFSILFMVGIAKSSGILVAVFIVRFDIPVALAALVLGVCGGMYTIAAPICVVAGQHYGQRTVVMIGGLVGGVGISLSCLLFSIEWVIMTFGALFGFGNACVFGNGLVIIGNYFNKKRGLAMGLALSGASAGQLVMPPLLQLLLDTYDLEGTLLIIGALYLNVMVCGALYRPASSYTKNEKKDVVADEQELLPVNKNRDNSERSADDNGNGGLLTCTHNDVKVLLAKDKIVRFRTTSSGSMIYGSVDSLHCLAVEIDNQSKSNMAADSEQNTGCKAFLTRLIDLNVLKSYISVFFLLISFLVFLGHFSFVLFLPQSATMKGITKYENALLISISGLSDFFGRILIGFIGDLNIVSRYKLYGISTIFCGFAIAGFAFSNVYWWMAIQAGLYGFFGGAYVAINVPVLIDFVGLQQMGKILGTVLFIQGLGAAIGQPSLGAVRDAMGSFDEVNYICSVSLVAGSILMFMYPLVKKLEDRSRTRKGQENTV